MRRSSSLPDSEVGRITDRLVGVGAVLSPAGLLAGGGALSPGHLLTHLLHHCLVLCRTLTLRFKKGSVTPMTRAISENR